MQPLKDSSSTSTFKVLLIGSSGYSPHIQELANHHFCSNTSRTPSAMITPSPLGSSITPRSSSSTKKAVSRCRFGIQYRLAYLGRPGGIQIDCSLFLQRGLWDFANIFNRKARVFWTIIKLDEGNPRQCKQVSSHLACWMQAGLIRHSEST